MVTKLNFTDNLSASLHYNEKKVQQEKATLIHAGNFLIGKEPLTIPEKQAYFQQFNDLNARAHVKTLHAKLSFPPGERLSDETLSRIAERYMQGIGFGEQPYLVYRHHDAAHPHMHIVSTLIRPDGTRIPTHHIETILSEPTRKAIEKEFRLEKAENHSQREVVNLRPQDAQKLIYGEHPTKESIQQVVKMAIDNYTFTSLDAFNAFLRQYNVHADRGLKTSQTYRHGGLTYKALDDKGSPIGVPIKASDFSFKPTLANLEMKFREDKMAMSPSLAGIRTRIDWAIKQHADDLAGFSMDLRSGGIDLMAWSDKDEQIRGLTFVDHKTRTVIGGNELGNGYSLEAIRTRLQPPRPVQSLSTRQLKTKHISELQARADPIEQGFNLKTPQWLTSLLRHEPDMAPAQELYQHQKKKKRHKL